MLSSFLAKGKTFNNQQPEYENKLDDQGFQIFAQQSQGEDGEWTTQELCFYDNEKTIIETYKYNLVNSEFIFETTSSPCFQKDGHISSIKFIYKLKSLHDLKEEKRKIKKSKL